MRREPEERAGQVPGRPRIIPPEAFDQPQPGPRRRRIGAWIGVLVAALVVLLGVRVLFPGSSEDDAPDDLMTYAASDAAPRRPGAAGSDSAARSTDRRNGPRAMVDRRTDAGGAEDELPTGRLLLFGDLPAGAWVELDGEVLPRRLALGGPLRVRADTTHTLAVHAEGFEPWRSDVEVPADSTLRLYPEMRRIVDESAPPARGRIAGNEDDAARASSLDGANDSSSGEDGGATMEDGSASPEDGGRNEATEAAPPARAPVAARDSLEHRLAQSDFLLEIGRYAEAIEELIAIGDRAARLAARYPSDGAALALRSRIDSALGAARSACRESDAQVCP